MKESYANTAKTFVNKESLCQIFFSRWLWKVFSSVVIYVNSSLIYGVDFILYMYLLQCICGWILFVIPDTSLSSCTISIGNKKGSIALTVE